MPTKANNQDTQSKLTGTLPDSAPSFKEEPINTAPKTVQADSNGNNNQNQGEIAKPETVVNTPTDKQEDAAILAEAQRANRINKVGIIVNFCLFLVTIGALWVTMQSVNEARRANTIAANAMIDSHKRDSISRIEDNIKDSLTFDLANRSLQAQIGSINQSRNQFQIQNEPFIQIANPQVVYNTGSNSAVVNYTIINIKDAPIEITKINGVTFIGTQQPTIKELGESAKRNSTPLDHYLAKETLFERASTIHLSDKNLTLSYLDRPDVYIFFYSEIEYTNLSNGKKKTYKYGAKLKHLKNSSVGTFYEIFYNKNV